MAFREVTMLEIKEVLRRWLGGEAKKRIARQLGVGRNTVRHYIEVAEDHGLTAQAGVDALTDERLATILAAIKTSPERARGEAWAKCEEQRVFIAEKLKERLRLSKVRKLLARRGVIVPYPTLHRFAVAELDFGRGAPTLPVCAGRLRVLELVTDPEQAQALLVALGLGAAVQPRLRRSARGGQAQPRAP